jgi:hypothetical protein
MNIEKFPSTEDQKQWLVDKLESTASWREMKAQQYPEDSRNASCAETLFDVAAAVKDLPDSHELFRKQVSIDYVNESVREHWLDEMNSMISRAGFNSPVNPQDFIRQLLEFTDASLVDWRQTS